MKSPPYETLHNATSKINPGRYVWESETLLRYTHAEITDSRKISEEL